VNLLLRFYAPKNVTRNRGLMLKLTSLHLLMMKIWTPLNTSRISSSTLRIRRLKGSTHTRTIEMIVGSLQHLEEFAFCNRLAYKEIVIIQFLDLEARSLQPNVKAVVLAKLREYKLDLNNIKSEIKKIVAGNLNPSARDKLLESSMVYVVTASTDQRERLMASTERLNKSGDKIEDSRRTIFETEDPGVSILQDLNAHRYRPKFWNLESKEFENKSVFYH
ncbi:hypothetical protein S83_047402, partial [Arachis hypogaea]